MQATYRRGSPSRLARVKHFDDYLGNIKSSYLASFSCHRKFLPLAGESGGRMPSGKESVSFLERDFRRAIWLLIASPLIGHAQQRRLRS